MSLYDKLFVNTCGMFNFWHYLTIALFALCLAGLLRLSKGLTPRQARTVHAVIAVGVSLLEVIKIASRIRKGYGPDSWVPLYYCSLFLFAVWFGFSNWQPLQRAGYAYMTMGGILAAFGFTLYPSTSLGMYPLLHPATLHSFVYHLIMCYTGILLLWKKAYTPQKRDGLYYFLFVFTACVAAALLNARLGTNCMFLAHPFGLPLLQPLRDFSHGVYMLAAGGGQAVAVFWLDFGVYSLIRKKKEERKRKHGLALSH